ncbi:MAG: hypothetical protein GY859_41300, partial [Desulfobacterales bacterium]|nr:hypothetical protein [Desulfobacterales bacterium]
PAVDPNYIHLVTAGGALQRFEGAFIPYLSDFEGDIDQSLFGAFSTAGLPPGVYRVYVVATPAGDLSAFYLWETYFVLN